MWKEAIVREIAVVLLIKLAALYAIWFAFFNQPDGQALSHHEVGLMLLGDTQDAHTSPNNPLR
jgi:hypothetical protein